MNKRIQELAIQAAGTGFQTFATSHFDSQEKIQKFGELIVRECIDVVDVGGEFVSRPKMVERLKEHFGVEE